MFGDGFVVSCGGKNASGNPDYGNAYPIVVIASLADQTTVSGSTTVYCPYFEGKSFLPLLLRWKFFSSMSTGWLGGSARSACLGWKRLPLKNG